MSTLVTGTIKSNTANPPLFQNTSGTEIGTLCRAWVNFNGTGTVAIRASYNVSSITDNGAGQYTMNFATALVDANYCVTAAGRYLLSNGQITILPTFDAVGTTTAIRLITIAGSASAADADYVNVAIFR
jgi:hypothetical protein